MKTMIQNTYEDIKGLAQGFLALMVILFVVATVVAVFCFIFSLLSSVPTSTFSTVVLVIVCSKLFKL